MYFPIYSKYFPPASGQKSIKMFGEAWGGRPLFPGAYIFRGGGRIFTGETPKIFRLRRALVGSVCVCVCGGVGFGGQYSKSGELGTYRKCALQRTLSQVLHYFFSTKIYPPLPKKNLWSNFDRKNPPTEIKRSFG